MQHLVRYSTHPGKCNHGKARQDIIGLYNISSQPEEGATVPICLLDLKVNGVPGILCSNARQVAHEALRRVAGDVLECFLSAY